MFKEITKDTWLLYAQQNYDNPTFTKEQEFLDDLKRFKYLKRLFRRYTLTSEIKVRLIVNHIIVLQNVFGVEAACVLLLYKIDEQYWPILKTVLIHLKLGADNFETFLCEKSKITIGVNMLHFFKF